MIPVTPELSVLLESSVRVPRFWAFLQLPVLLDNSGTADVSKLGSQIVLDTCLSARITKVLEVGSDTLDSSWDNTNGLYSPLITTAGAGKYTVAGLVDNKVQVYSGIVGNDASVTAIPEGIFVIQSFKQDSVDGANKATINGLDQTSLFNADIYAQFPPVLYGNQTSSFFNPAYALRNPSGDNQTFVCDAVNWMTDTTTAPHYASQFLPIAVYVGSVGSPASTPTTLTYAMNAEEGTIIFSSPIASNSIVSIDARPLGMAPELMLYHLLTEYGAFDPSFFKFDNSGIILPIMDNTIGQTILSIAQQIAYCTNPRGVRWQFFADELGYMNFRELGQDGPVVAVLVDQKDLLEVPAEYTAANIQNVVRAQITAVNGQPIEVISYDVNSINLFAQQPTYDVPASMIATARGMDPASAVMFLSSVCNSILFSNNTPLVNAEIKILYNPLYQVGDVVTVREQKTGLDRDFIVHQITKEFDGENISQSLRITEFKHSQDFQFGIAGVAGAPINGSSNTGIGQTSLLSSVSIAGTQVVNNGQPVTDANLNPVIPSWNGGNLTIDINTVAPPSSGGVQSSLWIFRSIYIAEDVYVPGSGPVLCTGNGNTLNGGGIFPGNPSSPSHAGVLDLSGNYYSQNGGNATLPYDFRANIDSASSRRFFRPLLRPSGWLSHDGVTAYTTAQSFSDTWTQGPGLTSSSVQFYGALRWGISNYYVNTTSGFKGKEIFAPGTVAANTLGVSSTVSYGVDFGNLSYNGSLVYGINKPTTPCYLLILLISDSGLCESKKIPFNLVV